MSWASRLWDAAKRGAFTNRDIIDAFRRETNLASEFAFELDEFGLVIDPTALDINDRFGWFVLSNRIKDAASAHAEMRELAAIRLGVKAA